MLNNENAYVVEMKEIVKTFPGTKALDHVTLKLRKGEIHALVGENGAGKSTLMNVLTGQFYCDSGEVFVEGEPVRFSSPKEALKRNIILVPQELNLIPEASVAENVFLGNEVVNGALINWKTAKKEAERLLDLLDVHIDVEQPVKNLSAAYQQLVSIARALAYEPKVLILDEPTAVLTNKETESLFASMQKLKQNGTAMVFISHHLDEIMEQCDRITIMKDGCLVTEVPVSEITKDEMINLMAGKQVKKTKRVKRNVSEGRIYGSTEPEPQRRIPECKLPGEKGRDPLRGRPGRRGTYGNFLGITEKEPGGEIYIEGKKANIKSPIDAIRYGLGYVSEERRHDGITPNMSVMENLVMPSLDNLKTGGLIDWKKAVKVTDQYIDSFKIKTASRETLIKNLSGGNQQKVIVARWMAKGIKMLILDEPTRGIDVNAKGEIHQLIRELADSGVSVVVISSEMEEVLALADRIMVVHRGKISGYLEDVDMVTQEDVLKIAFQ